MDSPQAVALTPEQVWSAHVRKAVLKFLKTAVVIDNDPGERRTRSDARVAAPVAVAADTGLGDPSYELAPPEQTDLDAEKNVLEIRKISDTFSDEGMACAFVLPEEHQDEDAVRRRVVRAAKTADILVIDWHLRNQTSSLTLKLLREIAEADLDENGRMRLICIYTGEPLDVHVLEYAKQQLSVGDLIFKDLKGVPNFAFCSKSKSSLVVLANKDETPAGLLPVHLIDLFAELANGLIPAFALAAVGAVRKNTHHMLTRFSSSLDSAYIANRLITNPPGDVAELMRELLVAECDNAIGLDSVADEFLEPEAIGAWLDVSDVAPFYFLAGDSLAKKVVGFDRDAINGLLKNGINDHGIKISNSVSREFPEDYRSLVSQVMAGSVEKSRRAENEFSRLVAFRREAYGSSVSLQAKDWLPSLTTGTLLRITKDGDSRYYLCFTPACDALRLSGARPFVFIEGVRKNSPYNLVVLDGRDEVSLYFDKNYPRVVTFSFKPDKKLKRVRARKVSEEGSHDKYVFTPEETLDGELVWLGEIRYGRAMSEMASLASRWMRVGILDSEYLRLASKKMFPFAN